MTTAKQKRTEFRAGDLEDESRKKKTQQPAYDQLKVYDQGTADFLTELPTEQTLPRLEALSEEQLPDAFINLQQSYGNTYVRHLIERIQAEKGSGQSLKPTTQSEMEVAFKRDFSDVHIHTDATADELAVETSADAFTSGNDIFFRKGAYQPGSEKGNRLLAHELTHVAQQQGDAATTVRITQPSDPAEMEAEAVSKRIVEGREVSVQPQTALAGAIARQTPPEAPAKAPETEKEKLSAELAKLDEATAAMKQEENRKTLMSMWNAMVLSQLNQALAAVNAKPADYERAFNILETTEMQNVPTAIKIGQGLGARPEWTAAMSQTGRECRTLINMITVAQGGRQEMANWIKTAIQNGNANNVMTAMTTMRSTTQI